MREMLGCLELTISWITSYQFRDFSLQAVMFSTGKCGRGVS